MKKHLVDDVYESLPEFRKRSAFDRDELIDLSTFTLSEIAIWLNYLTLSKKEIDDNKNLIIRICRFINKIEKNPQAYYEDVENDICVSFFWGLKDKTINIIKHYLSDSVLETGRNYRATLKYLHKKKRSNELVKMSMKSLDRIFRVTMSLKEQPQETIEYRIKNELHPYLSGLIKELIKKSARERAWRFHLYETKNDDYFIRANESKLLKWHSSNGCVYDDAVDVNVKTFLKEEIKTPDNILDLLRRISPLLRRDIMIAPWWRKTRRY